MPDTLKITLAQLNQSVGDIAGNACGMLAAREAAAGADLVVFPELHLVGYPPEDLILKPALIERAAAELDRLAAVTADGGPAMLVGTAVVQDGALHNAVALLDGGKVAATRFKHELPNYGTFDEMRLFQPGPLPEPVIVRGTLIGVPICEDIWRPDVCRHLANFGAEIFICVNGSPYEIDKETLRIDRVAKRRAVDTGLPVAYLNRVGGQDELVFDGASFVVNGDGTLAVQAQDWVEEVIDTRWTKTAKGWRCNRGEVARLARHPEDVYAAMVLSLRDYAQRNGFAGVLLGLSGGLDSALACAVAADALGPDKVLAVMLPSQRTGAQSLEDAQACARAIGCRFEVMGIETAVTGFDDMLAGAFAETPTDAAAADLGGDPLQARVRAVALMALASKSGLMLLAAGNKSALSVGRGTLNGDMAGSYNPLKDAYRTTVLALARWRNRHACRIGVGRPGSAEAPLIPESILARGPGGDLPRHEVLDPILLGLIEHDKSVAQLAGEGFARDDVVRVERLLHLAEHKRRQAPPGVKLGTRNFGRDRRYPITHAFRSG